MRRIVGSLVALAVLALAGCTSDVNPEGLWILEYTWSDSRSGRMTWHIFGDGKYIAGSGSVPSGTWDVDGNEITIGDSSTTYRGTFENEAAMSGTMTTIAPEQEGTWTATRVTTTP